MLRNGASHVSRVMLWSTFPSTAPNRFDHNSFSDLRRHSMYGPHSAFCLPGFLDFECPQP